MTMHDSPEGQQEKMRTEFEAEVLKTSGHIGRLPCGTYSDPVTASGWWAWQYCASQYSATIARMEEEKAGLADDLMHSQENEHGAYQRAAAAELSNRQLREAASEMMEHFASLHSDHAEFSTIEVMRILLAQPISTEALDAYVASKIKEHATTIHNLISQNEGMLCKPTDKKD